MHICMVYMYIPTCIQMTYATDIHKYRQTDRQTGRDRQTDGRTDRQTYIHTCMHACMHTHILPPILPHTGTHTHIHTCMHASLHACIHTYIHGHDTWLHSNFLWLLAYRRFSSASLSPWLLLHTDVKITHTRTQACPSASRCLHVYVVPSLPV